MSKNWQTMEQWQCSFGCVLLLEIVTIIVNFHIHEFTLQSFHKFRNMENISRIKTQLAHEQSTWQSFNAKYWCFSIKYKKQLPVLKSYPRPPNKYRWFTFIWFKVELLKVQGNKALWETCIPSLVDRKKIVICGT